MRFRQKKKNNTKFKRQKKKIQKFVGRYKKKGNKIVGGEFLKFITVPGKGIQKSVGYMTTTLSSFYIHMYIMYTSESTIYIYVKLKV